MFKDNTPSSVRFLILIFTIVLLGLFILPPSGPCSTGTSATPTVSHLVKEQLPQPAEPEKQATSSRKVIVIRLGDHFSGILERSGLSKKDALFVSKKADKIFKLNKMRPGSEVELYFTPDGTGLQEVDYKVNNRKRLVLYNGRVLDCASRSPVRETSTLSRKAGLSAPETPAKKSAVQASIRKGSTPREHAHPEVSATPHSSATRSSDTTPSVQNEPTADQDTPGGMSLVASYNPGIPESTADPYQTSYGLLADGKVLSPVIVPWDPKARTGDFSKQGIKTSRLLAKSKAKVASHGDKNRKKTRLAKQATKKKNCDDGFLKAPLTYRCISSGYTSSRIHPITNLAQPHYGIDYAAPKGTPVHAIGSGTVIYVGWDGGFGKTIRIRHKNGYVSHYGHLSRYAKGLRTGKRISRGDTIGFVGMTGIATGPHLDFRVTHQGSFINPASLEQHYRRISSHTSSKTQG